MSARFRLNGRWHPTSDSLALSKDSLTRAKSWWRDGLPCFQLLLIGYFEDIASLGSGCKVLPELLQAIVGAEQCTEHCRVGKQNLPRTFVRRRHPDE